MILIWKRVIRALCKKLTSLEPVKNYRQMVLIDQVDIILRCLKVAGKTVDNTFSKFFDFFLANKLDSKINRDCEYSHTSLVDFIMVCLLMSGYSKFILFI